MVKNKTCEHIRTVHARKDFAKQITDGTALDPNEDKKEPAVGSRSAASQVCR